MCVCFCVQYFSPYVSADMTKMAQAFNTTVAALEDELTQLILEGLINARIDSHSKVSAYTQKDMLKGVISLFHCYKLVLWHIDRFCMRGMLTREAPLLRSLCIWAKSFRDEPKQ